MSESSCTDQRRCCSIHCPISARSLLNSPPPPSCLPACCSPAARLLLPCWLLAARGGGGGGRWSSCRSCRRTPPARSVGLTCASSRCGRHRRREDAPGTVAVGTLALIPGTGHPRSRCGRRNTAPLLPHPRARTERQAEESERTSTEQRVRPTRVECGEKPRFVAP